MAHECPECGCRCYCNGDIDDCLMPDKKAEMACICCDDYDEAEYDDEDTDEYVSPERQKLNDAMERGDYLRDRAKDERAERQR